jgi:hypothetical protein
MDRLEDAVAEYTRAIDAGRRYGMACWLRARAQMELGNYAEAWADVHRAEDAGHAAPELREQLLQHMPEPEREDEG